MRNDPLPGEPPAAPPAANALEDPARLAALRATGLLESAEVATFDRVTRLAARALKAPLAQVNLVSADAQVPKAAYAPDDPEPERWRVPVGLASSFCQHVVTTGEPLVVGDARVHPLVRENRATTEAGIVAYASVPLRAPDGAVIGSVCVVDFEPREWSAADLEALHACAEVAAEAVRVRATASSALADTAQALHVRTALLEQISDAVLVRRPDGEVVYWNAGAERLYGYGRAEAIGGVGHALLRSASADAGADATPAATHAAIEDALGRDGRWTGFLRHTARDGRTLVTESRHVLLPSADGWPDVGSRLVLETNRDVTAERAATADLLLRNEELQEQGMELEISNQQLQESATELEAQTEELQMVAALLEDRTEAAERAAAALAESESRARALSELVPVQVWTAGPDGRLDYVSERTAAYFGVTAGKLLGDGWGDFAHPDDLAGVVERWTHSVATGEPYEVQFRLRSGAGGTYRWHLGRAVARRDAPGAVVGWVGSNTDIDDAKTAVAAAELARAQAEASEERFRGLSAASPVGIFDSDLVGNVVYANPRLQAIWEMTAEEMAGSGWTARVHPDDAGSLFEGWTAALREEREYEQEYRLLLPDGRVRVVHGRSAVVRDAAGRPTGSVGTIDDVTVRREAEAALRAAETRLRDIFEQAPVAVAVLVGPEHVYSVVSPRYAESPGTGRPLLGRPVREAFPELAGEPFFDIMDAVYETGEPFVAAERRAEIAGPDGVEERYFNVGYQPMRDAAGRVYGIASVAVDVTPQVQARRAVDVAREAAETARAAAETANEAKSQFLSTMSHELRTPLNAIQGYAELLSLGIRGPVTDEQQADFGRIRRATHHLMGLITDILNFARLDAGQVEYRIGDVRLAGVIADLESLVGPQLAAKGLRYGHDGCGPDTPETPHVVRADPERLRQVLLNLLTNAVKFTDAGGRVAVACDDDAAAGVVRIRVSDTGRGIAADQLERVFEPFVQVDRHRTHESQQGVGLGLAISRELARAMGGELAAESTEGVGSTFTLTLPRGGG